MEVFDDNLSTVTSEMLMVMRAANGIGLAAPQVGINKNIMVFNIEGEPTQIHEHEVVFINPEIIAKSASKSIGEEGCLSFPNMVGKVVRHNWVEVRYQTLTGERLTTKLEGYTGVIFQHEYDHLNKVL